MAVDSAKQLKLAPCKSDLNTLHLSYIIHTSSDDAVALATNSSMGNGSEAKLMLVIIE